MDRPDRVHCEKKRRRSKPERNVFGWLARSAALRILTSTTYLIIRFKYTLEAQYELSILDKLIAWIFLVIETGFAVNRLDCDLRSWIVGGKARSRPHLYFDRQAAPSVDILITYCGEGLNLLLDTVRAACALDYPLERFHIFVLDDSCSSSTERAVKELAKSHPNLQYTSRGVEIDTHSKAANLNHGLRYSKVFSAEGHGSELVAGLDVDMIPFPEWLKVLVPHVMENDRIAMAFIPQSFYNIPNGDPLGQMPRIIEFQEIQALQLDVLRTNVASGSGYVARRIAIEHIGGMPENTVAEDWVASMKLGLAGWEIAYVNEPLQWGLMPDSFAGQLKQRRRWQEGLFSLADNLHEILSESPYWELRSRLELLLFETSVILNVGVSALCFLAIPLVILSGRVLVLQQSRDQLKFLLRLAVVDMAAQILHGALRSWQTHFTIYIYHEFSEMWLNSNFLPAIFRHCAPKWSPDFLRKLPKFTPGGSATNRSPERDDPYRHLVVSRLKLLLWDHGVLLHLLILVGTLAGCWITLRNTQDMESLLVRGGWPPCVLIWTSVISNAWVPINYAIYTPKKSQREELVTRDPVSDVAYPSQKAQQSSRQRITEWQLGCVLMYTSLVVPQLF